MGQLKNNSIHNFTLIYSFITIVCSTSCKSQEKLIYSDLETALHTKNEVTILRMYNNKYSSFPLEIYNLSSLKIVSFTGSECDTRNKKCINIKQLPDGIKKITKLEELYLVMNNIKTISDEINSLKNLKILDLSNNTSLNLDNLNNQSIEILNLNGCYLSKIPQLLHKMKSLKTLGLEGNNIKESEIKKLEIMLPKCKIYR